MQCVDLTSMNLTYKGVRVKVYCSPAVQKACVHSACAIMNLYLLGNSLTSAPKISGHFSRKTKYIVKLIVLANRFAHDAYCCPGVVSLLQKGVIRSINHLMA